MITPRPIWGLSWQGRYLYVGGTNTGLHIVDAKDPAAPLLVKTIPTSFFGGISAGALFAIGNLLVITTPKESAGVATLDISDPVNPVLISTLQAETRSYIGAVYGKFAHLLEPFRWIDFTKNPLTIEYTAQTKKSEYMSFGLRPRHADGSGGDVPTLFLGGVRTSVNGEPGVHIYEMGGGTLDWRSSVPGRSEDPNIDDQFSVPVGNLLVVSDDQGPVGTRIAVHLTAADRSPPPCFYSNPVNNADSVSKLSGAFGVSFSDQIEFATVTEDTFQLLKVAPSGSRREPAPVPGRWGYDRTGASLLHSRRST